MDIASDIALPAIPLRGSEMHALNAVTRNVGFALFAVGLAIPAIPALANGITLSPVLTEQAFSAGNPSFLISPAGGYESADSFSLNTAATVTSISWWAADEADDGVDLDALGWQVRLAESADGLTDSTSSLSGTTYKGPSSAWQDADNRDVFLFDFILTTPRSFAAGTYYLYISNTNADLTWWWATGNGGDETSLAAEYDVQFALSGFASVASNEPDGDLALQIRGEAQQAIPEPGTLALLGLASMGLALTRRHRSSAA